MGTRHRRRAVHHAGQLRSAGDELRELADKLDELRDELRELLGPAERRNPDNFDRWNRRAGDAGPADDAPKLAYDARAIRLAVPFPGAEPGRVAATAPGAGTSAGTLDLAFSGGSTLCRDTGPRVQLCKDEAEAEEHLPQSRDESEA